MHVGAALVPHQPWMRPCLALMWRLLRESLRAAPALPLASPLRPLRFLRHLLRLLLRSLDAQLHLLARLY